MAVPSTRWHRIPGSSCATSPSLELRAAISLSRLWQQHGKHLEAHQLLAEVYGWFTEGLATPDLHEGRALLAEFAVTRFHLWDTKNDQILTSP